MAASLMKGRGIKTFILENFGAGLDLRETYFTLDQNRFAALQNLYITKGRKLRRRPPCILSNGAFDGLSAGLINIKGTLTTFAQRGTSPALPPGVVAAYFDPPPLSTAWRIADYTTVNNVACLLLLHTFAAGYTQYVLHVFDGAQDLPTYVTDSGFPWAHIINPNQPLDPSLTVAAAKLWCSGPDGNAWESITQNPRIWSDKEQGDFVTTGIEFHCYCPSSGVQSFTLPVNFAYMKTWAGYLSYEAQQYIGPAWTPQSQAWLTDSNWGDQSTPPVQGANLTETENVSLTANQVKIVGVANGAASTTYSQWTQLIVNPTQAGTWIRFRVQVPNDWPQPLVNFVASGCIPYDPTNDTKQSWFTDGDGATAAWTLPTQFLLPAANPQNFFVVTVGGSPLTYGTDYTVTATSSNGVNACLIAFTAVPANGALIEVDELYLSSDGTTVMVPPGTITTPTGTWSFVGGFIVLPVVGYAQTLVAIQLTPNQQPNVNLPNGTGLVTMTVEGGNGSPLYVLGQQRNENVPILVLFANNVGVYTTTQQPFIPLYRNQTLDQTLFLLAGAQAGYLNAGYIASSQYETSGGPITALVQYSNRLLILYKNASLLYSVSGSTANNRLLDTSAIGTGTQLNCYGAELYSMVIVPSINGFRALDLTRYAPDDNLQDLNIGDPIAALGEVPVNANCYWPFQGEYIAASVQNGQLTWFCFDYSKESKIASWSQWSTVGISEVDYRTMVPMDNRLYFRSGTQLYYFDAAPTLLAYPTANLFQDTNDLNPTINPSLVPFVSEAMWHYNNMKAPERTKRYVSFDTIQDGTATWTFRTQPWNPTFEDGGITWTGPSIGVPGMPLCMSTRAIGPVVRSTDPTGFNLEGIIINFCMLGQGVL